MSEKAKPGVSPKTAAGRSSFFEFYASHFPNPKEVRKVFLVILFPVAFWSLVLFSRELPSYLLRMSAWDITGVLAYTLVIAMLDSALLLLMLVIISLLVPARQLGLSFDEWGALLAIGIIVSTILLHAQFNLLEKLPLLGTIPLFWILPAALSVLCLLASFSQKFAPKIKGLVRQFLDRIDLAAGLFFVLVCFGLVIVIARNLGLH